MDPDEAYARRLLSEAESQIKSASKIITIVVTAIVVWWLTNLSTAFDPSNGQPGTFSKQLNDFVSNGDNLRVYCGRVDGYYQQANGSSAPKFADEIAWLKANIKEVKGNIDKKGASASAPGVAIPVGAKPIDSKTPAEKEKERIDESVKQCDALVPKVRSVVEKLLTGSKVELEGFKFANIHFRFYPATLAVLVLILAASISFMRWRILQLIDEALRLLMSDHKKKAGSPEYISLARPWWLIFIPDWRYGWARHRLSDVFAPPSQRPITVLFFAIVLIALALAYRDALIVQANLDRIVFGDSRLEQYLDLTDIPDDLYLAWSGHLDLLIVALSLAPLSLAVLGADSWFLPSRGAPVVPSARQRAVRRGLIGLIAVVGAPALAFLVAGQPKMLRGSVKYLASPATSWIDDKLYDDKRRTLTKLPLSPGWYVSASGTLHFVRADGTIKRVFGEFGEELRSVAQGDLVAAVNGGRAKFDASAYSEGVEASALNLWDQGETAAALQLLHLVIFEPRGLDHRSQSNLRLLDLYAGLQVLAFGRDGLTPLVRDIDLIIETVPPSLQARLESRKAAWSREQANWYSGWVPQTERPVRTWDKRKIDA